MGGPTYWSLGESLCGEGQDPRAVSGFELGTRLQERYRLGSVLGQGGAGVVYQADDQQLKRRVAVKVLTQQDPVAVKRFVREGELMAKLEHSGIGKVFSAGEVAGRHYLVFELLDGCQTLNDALPRLSRPQRLALFRQVVEAVAHAHERGVVHRDLKPENVLLDARGRPRVIDFGLGLEEGSPELTREGTFLGTPLYMAPERVFHGDRGSPAGDVWSLGVILYQLLTDRLPFPARGLTELADRLGQPVVPPRALDPTIDRGWDRVCRAALTAEPEARYPHAGALAAAIAELGGASSRGVQWGAALGVLMIAVGGWAALATRPAPLPATTTPSPLTPSVSNPSPTPEPTAQPLRRLTLSRERDTPFPDQRPRTFLNGRRLAVSGEGRISLWALDPEERLGSWDTHPRARACTDSAAVGFAYSGRDGTVEVRDGEGALVRRVGPFPATLTCAWFLPDGGLALGFGEPENVVHLVAPGELESYAQLQHQSAVRRLYANAEGTLLASGSGGDTALADVGFDSSVRLWEVASGDLRWEQRVDSKVESLHLLPGEERLAAGTNLGQLYVFDVRRGAVALRFRGEAGRANEFLAGNPAHGGGVVGLASLPSGLLLSLGQGSRANTLPELALWDPRSGAELDRAELPAASWEQLALLPSGEQVLLMRWQGAEVWNLR